MEFGYDAGVGDEDLGKNAFSGIGLVGVGEGAFDDDVALFFEVGELLGGEVRIVVSVKISVLLGLRTTIT